MDDERLTISIDISMNPLTSVTTTNHNLNINDTPTDHFNDNEELKQIEHFDLKKNITQFWDDEDHFHSNFIPKRSFNRKKRYRNKYNADGPTKGYWSADVSKVSALSGPSQSYSSSEVSDFLAHMTIEKPRKLFAFKTMVNDPTNSNRRRDENNMDHKLYYVAIDHAPELQIHDEINVISRHVPIQQYLGLTLSRFKKLLQDQPERIHLAFHGEYNEHKNETTIKFDTVPILPQLLLSDEWFLYKGRTMKYYRDYFAAISTIIEEEILVFINQPKNEFGAPLYKLRYINSEGLFDLHLKVAKLLKNIAGTRFQCQAVHYRDKKFIAVWYGKWSENEETKEWELTHKPNEWLMEQYYLSAMCRNRAIDGIVRQVIDL